MYLRTTILKFVIDAHHMTHILILFSAVDLYEYTETQLKCKKVRFGWIMSNVMAPSHQYLIVEEIRK